MLSLASVTAATFTAQLHSRFRLTSAALPPFDVELIQVTELRPGASGARTGQRAPFSILCRGPAQPWLPQGIYSLEHGELGTLELFLVPIGPDELGMRYEAIFN